MQADSNIPAALPRLAPEPLRERAANALRAAIVSGRMQPGDRLIEAELSNQLGISRGPVREALRQLEQEGLVTHSPFRGAEVLGVSQREIEQILVPIRLTIERFAFAEALSLLTDADFAALRSLVQTMRAAASAGDLDALVEADVRFHERVLVRSGQPHCLQVWRSVQARVRAYFLRDAPEHASPEGVAGEHQLLLDALLTRDEKLVLDTLERHILNFAPHLDDPEPA